MRRLGVVVTSALLALSLFAQGNVAKADIEWCFDDPVVVVFGAQYKITTATQASASAVTGYAYELTVPSNARGRTVVNYPRGLSATTVTINYTGTAWSGSGSVDVATNVTVSGPTGATVNVTVAGPSVASTTYGGTAGTAVSFTTSVTPGAAASSGASVQ